MGSCRRRALSAPEPPVTLRLAPHPPPGVREGYCRWKQFVRTCALNAGADWAALEAEMDRQHAAIVGAMPPRELGTWPGY